MPKRTAHIFEEKWRSDDVKLQEGISFSSFILPERVLLGLTKSGFKNPSPIQTEALPLALYGCDLVVQAKSGTGKTLVFTIAALDVLSVELKFPQILILAPTREIAFQICDVIKAVGCATDNLNCCTFIGGIPIETDFLNIQGCQIVVGTPGRITQLIELKIFKTHSIRLIVLDEADQLLEASFKSCMDTIFESMPEHRQTIATSATYPKSLAKLVNVYFRINPSFARLNETDLALLGITHFTCFIKNSSMPVLAYNRKLEALETILTTLKFSQCLVFCNQVSRVETLCSDIKKFGFSVTFISSAKDQAARLKAIDCLKRFKCKILVSSDVTSRGIDAENVDLIINVDIPYTSEVYLHRVGRAGRYGSKGVAITLVTGNEVASFTKLQKQGNFTSYDLPEPLPEKLIDWQPKTRKSSSLENLDNSTVIENNKAVSNGMEDDTLFMSNSDDQNTSYRDSVADQNTCSKHLTFDNNRNTEASVNQNTSSRVSALNQSTSSEEFAVNQNTCSEDVYQNTSSEDVNQNTSSEDVNQNTSSEDVNQNTSSEDVNQNTSSEDVNQNTSSEDVNQNTSSEDVNQNTSSEDVNQNTSSEDVNQNTSSEDVNQNTSSEDSAANQNTSYEDAALNQSTSAKDISMDESIISEDEINNPNMCSNTNVNQNVSFKETSVDQNIDSKEKSFKNTVSPAFGVVGQSSVDEDSDKSIGCNIGDVRVMNSKDFASANGIDKKCVLNKCKKKKSKKHNKKLKQKKSASPAGLSFEQNCLDVSGETIGDSLSEYEMKIEECTDEIIEPITNFINDYEKKNTPDLSFPLVNIGDNPFSIPSTETDNPNSSPSMRRNLIDYYYKVFQAYRSDFIEASGIKQLELIMSVNDETSAEKSAAVHIENKPIADQINVSLWAKKLGCSTYSASDCTDDSDVDSSSAEDILVSSPNAKASSANNTCLVVSSDTPPFPNSVDYQKDTSSSSGSEYSSKCLEMENGLKIKTEMVNRKQMSKKPKSKEQEVVSSHTESSSKSDTTSSSDADNENVQNINREVDNKTQVSKHSEDLKNYAQNTESSDTDSSSESETTSSSETDNSESEVSNDKTLLERAYREMVRSNDKPQTLAEQAGQLKQILLGIHSKDVKSGNGSDGDSLSGIRVTTACVLSPRKSFSSGSTCSRSSMKCESSKISKNTTFSPGCSKTLKGQQSKYQSDDEVESVSYNSASNCSQKRKVSKITKSKTRQRAEGFPSQLSRNESLEDAEHNNFYFSHSQTSRHAVGSHSNHQDQFEYAGYPRSRHNVVSRPSQYSCHRSCYNHHAHNANADYAVHDSSLKSSQCHHSCFNHQNAIHPYQEHSRSIQHCHDMNGSTVHPMSSESSVDMFYQQWYWIQHGSYFQ